MPDPLLRPTAEERAALDVLVRGFRSTHAGALVTALGQRLDRAELRDLAALLARYAETGSISGRGERQEG